VQSIDAAKLADDVTEADGNISMWHRETDYAYEAQFVER
jgi:hypothetical protein